ncbi:hypothetical protein R1flu_002011 [Riccia fluitans]|uniref:Uncharacterized protein n=1 Tax=Riccia fluitans TaxID=41844 RepID=A0ABD1Y4X9_9MARC
MVNKLLSGRLLGRIRKSPAFVSPLPSHVAVFQKLCRCSFFTEFRYIQLRFLVCGWFKARTKHEGKSSCNSSPSNSGGFEKSEGKQSGDWKSETDSNSRLRELENPLEARHPEQGDQHQYGTDRPQVREYGKGNFTLDGWPPRGSQESKDSTDGSGSFNNQKQVSKDFSVDNGKPQIMSDPCLRDHEKLHAVEDEFPRRSNTMGQGRGGARDSRYSVDLRGVQRQSFKEIDPAGAKFDTLLLNWPKLKWETVEKRRYEGRLSRLMEVETEIVVVGEEPIAERWSLGLVDDGVNALGRAIAARGYPKLRKLCFERCRIILESPFATLARAITATNLPNLEEIIFQHVSFINNQGFFELARAFKKGGHFSRLRTLILIDNGMRDEGLIALAVEGFASGNLSTLKKLRVGSHNTGKAICEEFHLDAVGEFAKEVSSSGHLPQLEDLQFSGCVESKGVVCLVEALETRLDGASLKCLDLSDSPLDSEGMRVLARAFEAPQFSSLLSLKLDVTVEQMPILLQAFQSRNLYALQRISLIGVCLGEKELLSLAALLEGKHLPGLLEFSAPCSENTAVSGVALVRAYENNDGLVARLNIGKWPMEELQAKYEKQRSSNVELDDLV